MTTDMNETQTIKTQIKGLGLVFHTHPNVFSPQTVDRGTLAMLSLVEFSDGDKVLDLGCGYGVVGILAAKIIGTQNVTLCDISRHSVALSIQNAAANGVHELTVIQSDGFDQVTDDGYTWILSNPPYHVDFSVPKRFIEGSYKRLAIGGRLVMVTKRLDWYKNKITSVFGGVRVHEIDGYYVFISEKRSHTRKKEKINKSHTDAMPRKLRRRLDSLK